MCLTFSQGQRKRLEMRIQAQAAVKAATHARKHNTEIEKKDRGEST